MGERVGLTGDLGVEQRVEILANDEPEGCKHAHAAVCDLKLQIERTDLAMQSRQSDEGRLPPQMMAPRYT